jgi:hypothetical protein
MVSNSVHMQAYWAADGINIMLSEKHFVTVQWCAQV